MSSTLGAKPQVRPGELRKGNPQGPSQQTSNALRWIINNWRKSLLNLCFKELLVFLAIFFAISCVQRYALNAQELQTFRELVAYFSRYTSIISLPFLIGFYLTIVASRWWQQYLAIPWPDRLMMALSMYSPDARLRRGLMRRCLLMLVLIFRHISDCVRERFTTTNDIVRFGLMTKDEQKHFDALLTDINTFWVPGAWFVYALRDASVRGILPDAFGRKLIMEEFLEFRSKCGLLWSYNWIGTPRVYGQVVKLAVYSFFAACLIGRQCIDPPAGGQICHVDRVIPMWTILEFLFYVGLLKVAKQMENPFGDDDEDFDLNFLIDRHVKAMRLDIDYLNDVYPKLEEDASTEIVTPKRPPCPIVKITRH